MKSLSIQNAGFVGRLPQPIPPSYHYLEYQQNNGTKDGFWKIATGGIALYGNSNGEWTYNADSPVDFAPSLHGKNPNYGNATYSNISGVTGASYTGLGPGLDDRHTPMYIWVNFS